MGGKLPEDPEVSTPLGQPQLALPGLRVIVSPVFSPFKNHHFPPFLSITYNKVVILIREA